MSSRSLKMCTGRFLRGQWLYCPRDMVESVVSSLSLVTRMPLYHSITMSLQLANTQHRVTESSAPPRPGLALIPTPLHGGTCCPANQRAARRPITGRLAAAPRTALMRGEAVSAQLAAREGCVTLSLSLSRHRDFTTSVVTPSSNKQLTIRFRSAVDFGDYDSPNLIRIELKAVLFSNIEVICLYVVRTYLNITNRK